MKKLSIIYSWIFIFTLVTLAAAQVALSGQNTLQGYTQLNVNSPGAVVTITSGNPPNCTNGCVYSFQVTAIGGRTPYTFSAVGLPTGLTINGSTGLITGNPSVNATFNGTINVQDFNGIMAQPVNFTIVISAGAPALMITSGSLSNIVGTVGQVFPMYTGTASGGSTPYNWTINTGALPGGLNLTNGSNQGTISGTYTTAGSFSGTLRVTDNAAAHVDLPFSFVVNPAPPVCNVVVSPLSANVQLGQSQQFTATVTNCNPTTVVWQVNNVTGGSGPNGTITTQGLYTAPATAPNPPTATISAISNQDGTTHGNATVGIISPTVGNDNLYCAPGDTPQFPQPEGPAGPLQNCTNTALSNTPTSPTPTVRTFTDTASFNSAIAAAACGDILQGPAGTVVTNPTILPLKACPTSSYIWIRTADYAAIPPEQSRISPCHAGLTPANFPGYVDDAGNPVFTCSSSQDHMIHFVTANSNPVISYTAGTSGIRWIGVDFHRSVGGSLVNVIIQHGVNLNHIIYDRILCRGTTADETTRCFNYDHTSFTALIDSWVSDMQCGSSTGQCTDAQAISGGTNSNSLESDKAWKATNNFLVGAAECMEIGGGTAAITPTDIEFRNNWCYKPRSWNPSDPLYTGGIIPFGKTSATPQSVKNHFECKNCLRVWNEGNVYQNVWGGFSQVGAFILMTPKNQQNGTQNQCPNCFVQSVVIRYNYMHSGGQAFQIGNSVNGNGAYALAGNTYSVYDNVIDNIGFSTFNQCSPADAIQGVTGATAPSSDFMHDVWFNDNTIVYAATACSAAVWPLAGFNIDGPPQPPVQFNFTWTNLITGGGQFGVNSAFSGTSHCNQGLSNGNNFKPEFDACISPYLFDGDMIIGGNPVGKNWSWPGTHNQFPTDWNSAGFVNYNGGSNGDYHLSNSSPGKGAGVNPITGVPDGHDIGAHIDTVNQFTSSVNNMSGGGTSPVGASPSGCSGVNQPTNGCVAAFPGFSTIGHTGAETVIIDPPPGNISTLTFNKWLYLGATTTVIGEMQPWFCPAGYPANCNSHKNIAMDMHNTNQLTAQLQAMYTRGITAVSVDWYGTSAGQVFNDTTTVDIGNIINAGTVPMQFVLILDQGAFVAACPQGAADETVCIENAIMGYLDTANSRWFGKSWYLNDNNRPLLLYFITESLWSGTNWTTVWSTVTAHIAGYAKIPKQIFRAGNFTHVNEDGEYAWPQPALTFSTTNQFFWGDNSSTTPNYIDNFLANCASHPTEVCIPYFAKGFDDSQASWGTGRVTGQQACNVLRLTTNEITHNNIFGPSNQLKYGQIATWNDYEEGTEIETGCDNTYSINATLAGDGHSLSWTITSSDSKASLLTANAIQIYYLDNGGNYILAKDALATSTTNIDLATITTIPTGTFNVYMVLQGMPYVWNKISQAVIYTH